MKEYSIMIRIMDIPWFICILEIQEEKDALKEYGSSSSGASIGDIIGAALEEDKTKNSKSKDEKK